MIYNSALLFLVFWSDRFIICSLMTYTIFPFRSAEDDAWAILHLHFRDTTTRRLGGKQEILQDKGPLPRGNKRGSKGVESQHTERRKVCIEA
jgi:hypothetical protein